MADGNDERKRSLRNPWKNFLMSFNEIRIKLEKSEFFNL